MTLQCRNGTDIQPKINVNLKFNNRMREELVNAILNVRTELKRDNIIKGVMIMTDIPEAVIM